jgi:flagellar basal-body rod protein FlgF
MDGIAWAGSALLAARTRLDIATENLANVSTTGFRASVARGFMTPSGVGIVREARDRPGALQRTGRDDDLAIVGTGAFRVRDAAGRIATTRNGSFARQRDTTMRDGEGRRLLGERGPLRMPEGARIDESGAVVRNGRILDRIPLPPSSRLRSGFLETAGVDAIREMVDVLCAERSFETAQKVVTAIDAARQKSSSDVARVK